MSQPLKRGSTIAELRARFKYGAPASRKERDTDPAAPKRKFWWQDASGGDIPPSSARRTSDRQQLLDQDHSLQLDDIDASLAQLASTHPALYQLISSTMVESHTEPSSQSSAPTPGTGQQQGTNNYLNSIHISRTTPQTGSSTTQMMSSRVADSVAEANALLGVGSRSTRVRQQQATTSAASIMQMASSGPKSTAAAASSEAYTEALMDRYRKGSTMAATSSPSLSKASNTVNTVKPGDLERGSSHQPSGSSGTTAAATAAATAADAYSKQELPASMHDSFEFDVMPPMEGLAVSGAAPKAVQPRLSATATATAAAAAAAAAADSAVTVSYVPPLQTQPSSTRQNVLEAQEALSRQGSTKDRRVPATGQSNYAQHGNVPSTSAVTPDTSISLTSAASIGDNVSYLPAAVQGTTVPLPKAVHDKAGDAEVTLLPGSGAQERSVASPTEIGVVSRQGSTRMPVPELPTGPLLSRQSSARGTASQAELPTEPLSRVKSSARDNSTSSLGTNYVPGSDPFPMDPESISAAADPTALSRSSSSSQKRHDPPRKQMSRLRISTSTDLTAAAAAAAAIQQVPSSAMTEEGSSPHCSPAMIGSSSRSRSTSPSKSVRSRYSNSAVTDQDSHSRGRSPQRQGSTVGDRPATAPAAGGASPTGIRSASSSPIFRSPRVSRSGGSIDVLQLPPPPPGLERLYSLAASAAQVAADMAEGGGNISSGAVDIAVVVAENAKRVINSLPQSRPGSSGSGGMDSAGSSAPGSPERRSRQPHPSSQAAAAATSVPTAAPPSHQHTLMTPSPPPAPKEDSRSASQQSGTLATLVSASSPTQQNATTATVTSVTSSAAAAAAAAAAQPSTRRVITSDSEQPAASATEQQQKQQPASVMTPQMSHQSSAYMLQSLPQSSSPPADREVGTVPNNDHATATSIPTTAAVVAPGAGKEISSQSKAGSSTTGITVQPVPPGIISVQPAVALALSAVTTVNQEQNTQAGQNPAIGNTTPAEQSISKESPPTLPPNPPAYTGSVAFTFPATSNHHHSAQHQGPSVLVLPQSASDPTAAAFSSSAPRHVQFHPHDEVREYLPSYPNSPASSVSSHFSPPFSTAAYGSTSTSPTAAPVLLPGVRGVRPPIIFLPLSQAHQPTQFSGVRNDAQPTTPTASSRSTSPSPSLSPPSSSTASPSAHTAAYGDTAVSIKPGQLSPSRSSSQPPSPASGLPGPTHIFLPLSGHHAPRLVNIPGHKAHPLPRSRSTSPSQNKSKIMSSDSNTNGGAGGGQSSERNKLQKGGTNGDHDIRSTSASSQQQDGGIVSAPQGQAGTPSPSPASDSSRPCSAHSAVGTVPPTPEDSSTAPQSAAVKLAGSTQPSTATAPAGAPARPSAAASLAVGKQQVAVVVPSSSTLLQDAAQETSTSAALPTPAQRAAVASSVDSGEATLKSKQQTDKERYSKPQRRITRLVEEVQRARKSGEEVKIRNEEKAKVQKMSFEDLEKYLGKQAALIVQLRKMQQDLTALQKNKGSLEAGRAMLDKALEFEKAAYETALDSEIERANMRELVEQQKQELSDTLQEMHLALRLSAHEATTVEQELVALEKATAAGLCTGGSSSTRTTLPPTSPMLMRQVPESPSLNKWRQMADSLGLSLSPAAAAAAGGETRGHNQLEPSAAVHSNHHIVNSSILSSQQLGLPNSAAPLRGGGINCSVQPEHQSYSFDREGDSAGNIRDAARHIATELDQALADLLTNMEGGRNHPHLLPNPEHHSFVEGLGSPTRHSNATRFLRSCRPCNTPPSLSSSLLPSLQNSQTTTIMPTAAMSSPLPPPSQPYYNHPASSQPPASYQLQLPPPPYAASQNHHNQGPANYNYNPSSPSRQDPPQLMMMPQGSGLGPSHHCHGCCHHHYEGKVKAVQALPSTAHNQCLSTCCSLASNTMAANPGSVSCTTAAGIACTVAHPLYLNWPGLGACPGEGMPTLHTASQAACHPTCCKATGPCLQSSPRAGPPSVSGTATVPSPQHPASILLVFPPQQQQQERSLSDQHPAAATSVLPADVAPGQSPSPSGFNCSNSTAPAATTAAVRGDAGGGQRRSVGLHDAFMAAAVAGGEQGAVVQPAVLPKPVQQPEMAAPWQLLQPEMAATMIMSPAPSPADALLTAADRMVSEEVESVVSQDDKQEVRLSGGEELRGSQSVPGELQNRSSRGIAIAAELGARSESHIDILTLPGRPYTTIDMLLTGSSAGVEAGTAAAAAAVAVERGAAESMSKSIARREAELNGQDALVRIPSGESAAAPPGSAAAAAASGVGDERMLLVQAAAHQEGPVQQLAGGMPASTRAPAKAAAPEFATSISYSGTDVAAAAASRQVSTGGSHLPYYHETVVPTPQNQTVSSVDMSGGISWQQQQQAAPGISTSVQQQQPWPPAVTMSWVPHAPGTARHQQQLIDMPYPHPNQTSAYLPGTAPVSSRQLHSSSLPASIQPAGSLQHQPGFVRGVSQDTYSPSPVSLMHQQYIAAPASSSSQQYMLPPFPSSQMPYMSQESSSSSQQYMPSHPSTFNPKPSTVHAGSHSSLPSALTTTTTYSSSSTRGSMAHQPNPPPTRHHNPADDTSIINASSTQPSSTQPSWGSSAAALLHSQGGAGHHIHYASSSHQSNKPAVNPDYATRYHASTHQHTTAGYAYPSHSIPSSSSLSHKTLSHKTLLHPQLLPQHHAGSLSQPLIHPNYYQPHLLHAPPHSYPSSYEQPQQSRSDGSDDGLVVAATRAVQLISEVGLGSSSRDSSLAGTMNNTVGSQQHQAQRHPNRSASSSAQFPGSAPQYQQDLQLSQRGEVLSGYKGQSSAPPVHHQSYQLLQTPHFSHTSTAAVHQQYHDTLSAQMRAVYGPSYRPV